MYPQNNMIYRTSIVFFGFLIFRQTFLFAAFFGVVGIFSFVLCSVLYVAKKPKICLTCAFFFFGPSFSSTSS